MVSNTNIIILHMQINMDVEQVPINWRGCGTQRSHKQLAYPHTCIYIYKGHYIYIKNGIRHWYYKIAYVDQYYGCRRMTNQRRYQTNSWCRKRRRHEACWWGCDDEDVMAMPRYNEPKKANNAKVLPQNESSSIETYFFIFGN
jgi:hypothetical protein